MLDNVISVRFSKWFPPNGDAPLLAAKGTGFGTQYGVYCTDASTEEEWMDSVTSMLRAVIEFHAREQYRKFMSGEQ